MARSYSSAPVLTPPHEPNCGPPDQRNYDKHHELQTRGRPHDYGVHYAVVALVEGRPFSGKSAWPPVPYLSAPDSAETEEAACGHEDNGHAGNSYQCVLDGDEAPVVLPSKKSAAVIQGGYNKAYQPGEEDTEDTSM